MSFIEVRDELLLFPMYSYRYGVLCKVVFGNCSLCQSLFGATEPIFDRIFAHLVKNAIEKCNTKISSLATAKSAFDHAYKQNFATESGRWRASLGNVKGPNVRGAKGLG